MAAGKNRLASAEGKHDVFGVDDASDANGNQEVLVAPALLTGPGAQEAAASPLMKLMGDPFGGD